MATYKEGQTVIVTQDGVNRVGVVLDRYLLGNTKMIVHDILLENRSAVIMINNNKKYNTYINNCLTPMLCNTVTIQKTIPYKQLVAEEALPSTKA
jgi:hypothetical protein